MEIKLEMKFKQFDNIDELNKFLKENSVYVIAINFSEYNWGQHHNLYYND